MEKKIYYELKDNEEMNVTCHTLDICIEIIKTHVSEIHINEIEGYQFTITPVMLTDDEYAAIGESNSY